MEGLKTYVTIMVYVKGSVAVRLVYWSLVGTRK